MTNDFDAELMRAIATEADHQVSVYQLERWRRQGLFPRNQVVRLGRRGTMSQPPDMPPDDLASLAATLADLSTRGRPWQHVGLNLLWLDTAADVDLGFPFLKDTNPCAYEPHFLLGEATLQALATASFQQPRRAMARSMESAMQSASADGRSRQDALERVITDAGNRFRRTEIGRRFIAERKEGLRQIYQPPSGPTEDDESPRRFTSIALTEEKLADKAVESMNWMMADATVRHRLTEAQRNSARYGQPHRPYRAMKSPPLVLYSDLDRCAATLTEDELYSTAEVLQLSPQTSHLHSHGALSWMRYLLWDITTWRFDTHNQNSPLEAGDIDARRQSARVAANAAAELHKQVGNSLSSTASASPEVH